VIIRFVDIGGIVDHNRFNFLFININKPAIDYYTEIKTYI